MPHGWSAALHKKIMQGYREYEDFHIALNKVMHGYREYEDFYSVLEKSCMDIGSIKICV